MTDREPNAESAGERGPVHIQDLRFDDRGLMPAVVQDAESGDVLMVAWMNLEAVQRTMIDGRTWFYSRSRRELWPKGETSGHVQHVEELWVDCDADTILVKVHQTGVACHTGERTCFHRKLAV
jgi:phosphoribosyl-AMP cyclohydrolase